MTINFHRSNSNGRSSNQGDYRRFSGYDGLDLRCFEVTNTPHKNIKDNKIEAVKLDHCDQELQ